MDLIDKRSCRPQPNGLCWHLTRPLGVEIFSFCLQTNVFANAQKRKSRPFTGYATRRVVVVVPTDEEYKARLKSQEEAGNKDIPDEAIMEMKGRLRESLSAKLCCAAG